MIKEALKKEFLEKKLKHEYDAEINLTLTFEKFPDFKKSYDTIRSCHLDYAKLKYQNIVIFLNQWI